MSTHAARVPARGAAQQPHAIPTSIAAWSGLPVAERLTSALVAPDRRHPVVSEPVRAELWSRIEEALRSASEGTGRIAPVRITPFSLRRLHAGRPVDPFRWSPWTARRAIGIAAARRCLDARECPPAREVVAVVSELADGATHPGTLGAWLAGLTAPVAAVTIAEATTWATNLLDALDWSRPDLHPVVAATDRWWHSPDRFRIGVRGRVDVSVAVAGHSGDRQPRASLTMMGGSPGPMSHVELGLDPLVAALDGPGDAIPVRVAGWWPACGRLVVLPVDRGLLVRTAEAVLTSLGGRSWTEHWPAARKAVA